MHNEKTSPSGAFGRISYAVKQRTGGYGFTAFLLLCVPAYVLDLVTQIPDHIIYLFAAVLALPCAILFNRRASSSYKREIAEQTEAYVQSTSAKQSHYARRIVGILILPFWLTGWLIGTFIISRLQTDRTLTYIVMFIIAYAAAAVIADLKAQNKFKEGNGGE